MTNQRRSVVTIAVVLVAAACTSGATPGTGSLSSPSTTTIAVPSKLQDSTIEDNPWAFRRDTVSWSRQVVAPSGPPLMDGWYQDIAAHPVGFIAAGVEADGLVQRPMAWLSPDGLTWSRIGIPSHLEGRFTSVANNGEVTVLVGYETGTRTGMVVRVPRGAEPVDVDFDDSVAFFEVIATGNGFIAYGIADPTGDEPRPAAYISDDGSRWDRVDVLPLAAVAETVADKGDWLLEIEQLSIGQSIRIREAASLFGEQPVRSSAWDVELATEAGPGFGYAMTGIATETGFLIGGGDVSTGRPRLWRVGLPGTEGGALDVEPLEIATPADSRLSGDYVDIRNLARSGKRIFAIVAAQGGAAEAWSSTDTRTWTLETQVGVHPSSNFYASAESQTGEGPSAAFSPGTPLTLVLTADGFPSDLWMLGDEVVKISHSDLVAYQANVFPLLIGSIDGSLYARVVEHAPRWSQTDPDIVRSRVFSEGLHAWHEVGATAWDRGARIQSILEVGSATAAFGTTTDFRGNLTNQKFSISDGWLGEDTALEGAPNGVELFEAAATTRAAVVVGADTLSTGDRIVAWYSEDLVDWTHIRLEETVSSLIGAVCTGLDRVWVMGHQVGGFFSSGKSWSTADGATWMSAIPSVSGADEIAAFTACGGGEERIVAAGVPGPSLIMTSDGLTWETIGPPPGLEPGDRIVEVALDGERVGVVVQHPAEYVQPQNTSWLWDGEVWHRLEPEPDAHVASIALKGGVIYLAGLSMDGATIWHTRDAADDGRG